MGLFDRLIKQKKKLNWQEVAREPSEKLAKVVRIYWDTIGMKTAIKKRQDGKYSVFILNTVTGAEEFGGKPK